MWNSLLDTGINYQPQLVSRISSFNNMLVPNLDFPEIRGLIFFLSYHLGVTQTYGFYGYIIQTFPNSICWLEVFIATWLYPSTCEPHPQASNLAKRLPWIPRKIFHDISLVRNNQNIHVEFAIVNSSYFIKTSCHRSSSIINTSIQHH